MFAAFMQYVQAASLWLGALSLPLLGCGYIDYEILSAESSSSEQDDTFAEAAELLAPTAAAPDALSFGAVGVSGAVLLAWTPPNAPEFERVVIRRSTALDPASPTAGTGVCDPCGEGPLLDEGLVNGLSYRYTAFALDAEGTPFVTEMQRATPAERWSLNASELGFFKALNAEGSDVFGGDLALAEDGNTMLVGAAGEDSAAEGINGDANDNSAPDTGAAYIFERSGEAWMQTAYLKAEHTDDNDTFGSAVALSADGQTAVVSALFEDSDGTGIDGDLDNNLRSNSGAVYLFSKVGGSWVQQHTFKASDATTNGTFGFECALSADGHTLAVAGSSTVYLFAKSGNTWAEQSIVEATNTSYNAFFGFTLALSADGNVLAVAAPEDRSGATGINGDANDTSAVGAGAVYVFARTGSSWSQQAYIKASNTGSGDAFGDDISLSADGQRLAVSADNEDSASAGINGDDSDDSLQDAGAVYLFRRSGGSWAQEAYLKAHVPGWIEHFGSSLTLSASGRTLAVGARQESSDTYGIGVASNDMGGGGAAYLFELDAGQWKQTLFIRPPDDQAANFGRAMDMGRDGGLLLVGDSYNGSLATGIDGDHPAINDFLVGAAHLYGE